MKRILSLVLSLALALSVAAVAGITVSAAVDISDAWLYIGADGTASTAADAKVYTKSEYPNDPTGAFEAAIKDVEEGNVSLSGNPRKFICVNADMTLTRQLSFNGTLLRIQNIGYTVTAPEGSSAINGNGKNIWLYGNPNSVPSKPCFVASTGNAFFENSNDTQIGGNFKGDLSFKDIGSFKLLGGNSGKTFDGNFIFSGTFEKSSAESSSANCVVKGKLDYSAVTTPYAEASVNFANLINYPSYLKFNGGVVTNQVVVPTITMDDGAAMRIDNTTDGLRFSATVDQEALNKYTANVSKVAEQGMLIAKSGIDDSVMTIDNAKVSTLDNYQTVDTQVVVAKYDTTMETVDDAGVYKLYGSLVKIDLSNATQGYVAKAYIKFENGTVVYSDMSEARTINEVAAAVFADKNYFNTLCENHKEAVTKWIPVLVK